MTIKADRTVKDLVSELAQGEMNSFDSSYLSCRITGVTSDSREVKEGFVFVAVQGGTQDGSQFIDSAVQSGAVLVVGEQMKPAALQRPYLQVKDARIVLARIASQFYGNPSEKMLMIGVTGTSGKTTTTYLLESILNAAGYRVGLIGTVNFRFGSKIYPSTHTTPGAVELQKLLSEMKEEGCTAVVMEVSSHALKQQRVAHIAFDGMIFTNLSPEHLDFHPDMEDYFQSKKILFTSLAQYAVGKGKKPFASINNKDNYGRRLLEELSAQQDLGIGVAGFDAGEGLPVTLDGIRGSVSNVPIQSSLTGQFNCANIEGAVTLALGLGIKPQIISKGISNLAGVPGRLERVQNKRGVHVWVDYAHKPDALEKVVKTLREIRGNHRLITVVGCGGDRDRKKRPVMGEIAVKWSDHVFITSDNPRTEDPQSIIQEILTGVVGYNNFTVEVDRKKAIIGAVRSATRGDLVLIAGKGHEDYQIIGTQKVHFDDREIAAEAFNTE